MRFRRARSSARPAAACTAALLGLTIACSDGGGEEAFRPIAVGTRVPDLTVRTLTGDTARVQPGQPVTLLNVWATWCGPCEKEFPEIEALQREFGTQGLRILAVSVDEGADAVVRDFVAAKGATFQIGRDPGGFVRRVYQGIGVPESYLIASDGTLLVRQFGAIPAGAAAIRAAIADALSPETESD